MKNILHAPFYCRFIANFPILAFLLSSTIHVFAIVMTVSLVVAEKNVFPVDFETVPLVLYDDSTRKQDLAWRSRDDYPRKIYRPLFDPQFPLWLEGQVRDTVEVILQVDNGEIFSKNNLILIQYTENLMYNITYSTYCQKDEDFQCVKPKSIIRLFDGTYLNLSSSFTDLEFNNPKHVLCCAMKFNETKEYIEYFLPKDYDPCQPGSVASITRLLITICDLFNLESEDQIRDFLIHEVKPNLIDIRNNIIGDKMHMYFTSKMIYQSEALQQTYDDVIFAIGSFLFIFLVMWIQTKSFFITSFGIYSILTSFLLANLIYRFILSYEYFGFLHIVSIFIILGIGADDVFVFYDSWRLTGKDTNLLTAHRLAEFYNRAAKTTFVTSLTTLAAFLVSGTSPLLPIRSFGLFTGILVGVNYVCDLVFFPTAIVLYSEKIRPKTIKVKGWFFERFGCCVRRMRRVLCEKCTQLPQEKASGLSVILIPFSLDTKTEEDAIPDMLPEFDNLEDSKEGLHQLFEQKQLTNCIHTSKECDDWGIIIQFLRLRFFTFMNLRPLRIIIPVLFFGISSFFIYNATKLEPDSNRVKIFRPSHNQGKATLHHYYTFQRNFREEHTSVYLVWGLLARDMSECSRKKSGFCRGKMVWDDKFDPSSAEAQVAIYDLCQRLENGAEPKMTHLRIKTNIITGKPEVSCYLTTMELFLQKDLLEARERYPSDLNVSIPLDKAKMTKFMNSNSQIYNTSHFFPEDFDRWLEIGLEYWITNKYTGETIQNFIMFDHLIGDEYIIGETDIVRDTQEEPFMFMFYGTKLRYFGIQVNLSVNVNNLGYSEGSSIYQAWEQLITDEKDKMPASLKNGFQCTRNTWHWIRVQEMLSDSAIQGIIIGLSLALLVLILTTMNFIIGFLAWIVILLVTVCVVGSIPLQSLKLGMVESINLCMVVGLAVDYVVHLAEAYNMSPFEKRQDKTPDMLGKMGFSVISGALTTFGASVFMIGAQIQFIYEFGKFVMITASMSLLFSLFVFTSLMLNFGPEGDTGSIKALCRNFYQSKPSAPV
ncbi:uncharacterized protein LOC134266358 [Saccostrea cucullata]|uniref:uncharacterized protein LOC134266358 n=1 Tax=Saccostrea cuccullata TaxID=36930 RepID=UPI002ED4B57B